MQVVVIHLQPWGHCWTMGWGCARMGKDGPAPSTARHPEQLCCAARGLRFPQRFLVLTPGICPSVGLRSSLADRPRRAAPPPVLPALLLVPGALPGTTGQFLLRLELCEEGGPVVALGCCVLGAHVLHAWRTFFCQELCIIPTCRVLSITHSSGLGFKHHP